MLRSDLKIVKETLTCAAQEPALWTKYVKCKIENTLRIATDAECVVKQYVISLAKARY